MIINTSYFKFRPLVIPAATLQPASGIDTPANVQLMDFINEKERCLLLSFLGFDQLNELFTQLNEDGTFIDGALQKWVDLVNGKDVWKGLRYEVFGNKVSLIAYYVYFYYVGQDAKYLSNTGVADLKAANSTKIAANDKQVMAWSEFLKMYGYNQNYTGLNYSFFHNWNGTGMQWGSANNNSNETTLIDFLTKNSDVYDTSKITYYQPVNSLGL